MINFDSQFNSGTYFCTDGEQWILSGGTSSECMWEGDLFMASMNIRNDYSKHKMSFNNTHMSKCKLKQTWENVSPSFNFQFSYQFVINFTSV